MMKVALALATALLSPALASAGVWVEGQVLDASGAAVPSARVELLPYQDGFEEGRLSLEGRTEPEPASIAATGEDGWFRLEAPGPGMWRLAVRAPGTVSMERELTPLVEATVLPPVILEPDAGVTVTVTAPGGQPAAGAWVSAHYEPRSPEWRGAREAGWRPQRRRGRTGEEGTLRLPRLAQETLHLQAFHADFLESEVVAADAPAATLALRPGRPLEIVLRDPRRRPVADALVLVGERRWSAGLTDPEGRLRLTVDPAGPLHLTVEIGTGQHESTEVEAPQEGAQAPEGPQTLELPPPTVAAGRVLDAVTREPVAGALVWPPGDAGGFTATDPRGGFELVMGLQRRTAGFAAAAPGYRPAAAETEMPEGGRAEVPTMALEPAVGLLGRVVDGEDRPVPAAVLRVQLAEERSSPRRREPAGTSGENGRFRLRGLEPGRTYRLAAEAQGFSPAEVTVSTPDLRERQSELVVVLSRGRTLFGRVLGPNEQPLPGAEVTLLPAPEKASLFDLGPPMNDEAWTATTGAGGRFEIRYAPAGRYDLFTRLQGFAPTLVPGLRVPEGEEATDLGTVVLVPGVAVEGRVVDGDGAAVEGARVQAMPEAGMFSLPMDRRRFAEALLSDTRGRFTVVDLRPGERVTLVAAKEGYVTARSPRVEAPSEGPVEVVLELGGGVAGEVVDLDGRPMPRARVEAGYPEARMSVGGQVFPVPLRTGKSTLTDAEGRFRLEGLEPGTVTLTAEADGFPPAEREGIAVEAGATAEGVRIVLSPGAVLEGTVRGPDGAGVAGVTVTVAAEDFGGFRYLAPGTARSDAEGRFRVTGLEPGSVRVEGQHRRYPPAETQVDLRPGVNRADLVFEEGQEVAGWVVDAAGEAVPGARVTLAPAEGGSYREAVTGPEGAFDLAGVSPGRYHLTASAPGFAQGGPEEPLEVKDQPLRGITVELAAGGAIRGRLLGLEFDELPQVIVFAHRADGSAGYTHRQAFGRADFEGRYSVPNLTPGRWEVSAQVGEGDRTARGSVTLERDGEEAYLDLDFSAGLTFSGLVRVDGQPAPQATVQAYGAGGGGSSRTNHLGRFRIGNLEPGSYQVQVALDGSTVHRQELELSADEDVVFDLATGAVSGVVVDAATGSPVELATVSLEPGGEERSGFYTALGVASAADGSFRFARAGAGPWRLVARKEGYAPAELAIEVVPGGSADGLVLTLERSGTLNLRVRLWTGAVPGQLSVTVLGAQGQVIDRSSVTPGPDGSAVVRTLPRGNTGELLLFSPGSAILAVPLLAAPPPVLNVVLPQEARLAVLVPELAGSGGLASLTLLDALGRPFGRGLGGSHPVRDGRATVQALSPGTWTLRAVAPGGATWTGTVTAVPGSLTEVILTPEG